MRLRCIHKQIEPSVCAAITKLRQQDLEPPTLSSGFSVPLFAGQKAGKIGGRDGKGKACLACGCHQYSGPTEQGRNERERWKFLAFSSWMRLLKR